MEFRLESTVEREDSLMSSKIEHCEFASQGGVLGFLMRAVPTSMLADLEG